MKGENRMNTLEESEKVFELLKLSADVAEAQKLYCESKKLLERYERTAAIQQIQKIIARYEFEINAKGVFQCVYVIHGVDYSQHWDMDVMAHLLYLTRNIPVYECLKQGKEEMAKSAMKRIEENTKETFH